MSYSDSEDSDAEVILVDMNQGQFGATSTCPSPKKSIKRNSTTQEESDSSSDSDQEEEPPRRVRTESNASLDIKSSTIRDSLHLTAFEIEDEDVIYFGKPLTSGVTSGNISRNRILNTNYMPPPKPTEEEIIIEEAEPAITTHVEIELNGTLEKEDIRREMSFYQKWFNFNSSDKEETEKKKEEPSDNIIRYKVALLGEDLYESFFAADFVNQHYEKTPIDSTIQSSSIRKRFDMDGKAYELELFFYDIYEQFINIMDQCLKQCDGFLLVFNVADRKSFLNIDMLYDKLYKAKQGETIAMVLVGMNYPATYASHTPIDKVTSFYRVRSPTSVDNDTTSSVSSTPRLDEGKNLSGESPAAESTSSSGGEASNRSVIKTFTNPTHQDLYQSQSSSHCHHQRTCGFKERCPEKGSVLLCAIRGDECWWSKTLHEAKD